MGPDKGTVVFNSDSTVKYKAWLVEGSYFNWEFRYPIKILGSTKGRVYVANYLDEWHAWDLISERCPLRAVHSISGLMQCPAAKTDFLNM